MISDADPGCLSRIPNWGFSISDLDFSIPGELTKSFKYFLTQNIITELSEICSDMLISDPGSEFWIRGQKSTGFRILDPQHCKFCTQLCVLHTDLPDLRLSLGPDPSGFF